MILACSVKLSPPITQELVDTAKEERYVETLGARAGESVNILRYQLTEAGRNRAIDALSQSEYYGAMPVTLDSFTKQVQQQRISIGSIKRENLEDSLSHLVLEEGMLDKLGPAVNSGRSILMYGPPGNGKSSIANGIRDAISDYIFVPYYIEYAGSVISVFDPLVHIPVDMDDEDETSLRRKWPTYDKRYSLCRRPSVLTGGELTLDMLDLNYNEVSRTYEAPLQMKACGGVFIVDDLGRQSVKPQSIINRWIVPMEQGVDILALKSGQKFMVPFDTVVIFSTNFRPTEMFDGAALRRIYYKIKVDKPNRDDFIKIFIKTCRRYSIRPDETVLAHLIKDLYPGAKNDYSSYHAPFLLDQMMSICAYEGRDRQMSVDLLERAWDNLFVDES